MYYTTLYGMLDQAVFGDFSQPDMTWQFLFDDYEEYDHVFCLAPGAPSVYIVYRRNF